MNDNIKLSLVLPAFNEGERIYKNLLIIDDMLKDASFDYEILPVNDGSSDNTKEECLKASMERKNIRPISYDKNRGKGGAIKEGVKEATGTVIGFLDSDLDISPSHLIPYMNAMIESKADVVIASKMHKESKVDYPFLRKVFSWGYFVLTKILFGTGLKDTQTGLKLYESKLIKDIMPRTRIKGYAFDIEILSLCIRKKAKILEMPVEINFQRLGTGRIKIKDIIKMFSDTVSIWWNLVIRKTYLR